MTISERRVEHGESKESVGDLVSQASQQLSQLVREELRLAQAEMTQKGKRFGKGGGMFGGAGIVAFIGLQALAATAIAALVLVLPLWAAALIITGVLFVIAAVLAAMGKKQVGMATPPTPERAIDSVKADVAAIKESAHR
ncbi:MULTISPECIES: phage holin family protein [unclassified Streptomyces]|uniref:phage holin family protein n=1 Tax=unclassified Streptomyces TaxID=2593676 RepID=UPI0028C41AE5|nr:MULTISPECIES: phage holin family protein [unclassified Streptomyces]WNO76388.1 phage holin family protein [Streptomyces sp. AM8-1-1]